MRARCAQRGGLGWAAQAVFRLEGVLRFSGRRGRHSGGVRLARLGAGFTTLLWLSRRACFLDLLAARIDVYEENERRSTPHAVLVGRTGCSAVRNEPKHSSPKSFTGAVVLTPKSAIT